MQSAHNADFFRLRISKMPANAHEMNYFSTRPPLQHKKENQIPPVLFLITAPTAVQYFLLISPDNPALRQIIRRQFNRNFISGKNTNKVHT